MSASETTIAEEHQTIRNLDANLVRIELGLTEHSFTSNFLNQVCSCPHRDNIKCRYAKTDIQDFASIEDLGIGEDDG